jgi:hypothetical protein
MTHTTESGIAKPTLMPPRRQTSLVQVGGALGIAATCIAMAVFLVAILNFDAVFILAPLPIILGGVGLILAVVGGIVQKHVGPEETQPIAAMFVTSLGLIAGLIELFVRPR